MYKRPVLSAFSTLKSYNIKKETKWSNFGAFLSREVLLDYETEWSGFYSTKKHYWRICKAQEEEECSNSYILMSVEDHGMEEYIKKVTEPPDHYKQKDLTKVSTFEVKS